MPPCAGVTGAPVTEMPAYWFCLMESGRESGDFDLAARAKRELERLGVLVTYRRPRGPRPKGGPRVA